MTSMAAKNATSGFRAALTHCEPLAIGLAVFFGVLWGWLPKPSLFAMLVFVAPFFVRANLLVTFASSIIAWLSFDWMAPKLTRFGSSILEAESLQSIYLELSSLPVLPWLDWDNNLVIGSLAWSLVAFAATYSAARCLNRNRRQIMFVSRVELLSEKRDSIGIAFPKNAILIDAVEPVASQSAPLIGCDLEVSDTEPRDLQIPAPKRRDRRKSATAQHRIDAEKNPVHAKPKIVEATESLRASAAVVNSQATSFAKSTIDSDEATKLTMSSVNSDTLSQPAVLKETVIEIVRYKPHSSPSLKGLIKGPLTVRTLDRERIDEPDPRSSISNVCGVPSSHPIIAPTSADIPHFVVEPFAMLSPSSSILSKSEPIDQVLRVHSDAHELTPTSMPNNDNTTDRPREEALRYLLWHLSGVKRNDTPLAERSP